MRKISRKFEYFFPVLLILTAIGFQVAFRDFIGQRVFVFFYPVLYVGALFGTLSSGVVATLLATTALWYLFLTPYYSFSIDQFSDVLALIVFTLTGFFASYLSDRVRRSLEKIKNQENDTRTQANTFDTALSSSSDFYYVLDREHRFTYVNRPLLKLWGRTLEEAKGKTFKELGYSDELVELHKKQLDEVLTGKVVKGENSYVNPEGVAGYYEYQFIPIFDTDGSVQFVAGTTRDTTERKHLEEGRLTQQRTDLLLAKSQESETQFRKLADSMPQLAWIAKADGYIFWYNQGWYKYTGTTPEQMEGWGWQSVHHPEYLPEVMRRWPLSIETGEPFEMEFPLRGKDGKFRWFLTRATPIRDAEDKVTLWFGTNTDIDEQRLLGDKLKQAISMRDEFISVASHEFKTPITSLMLQLQTLQRQVTAGKGPSPEKLSQSFSVQLRSLDRLTQLVEELLDVTRMQSGKLQLKHEPVDVSSLVEDLVQRFRDELAQVGCPTTFSTAGLAIVDGDRFRLEQVFVNLFTNVMKYASGKPVEVRVSTEGQKVSVTIKDHGKGISQENLGKIFNRFERATSNQNISGLGLGLYIVKEIVTKHRGTIDVKSVLNEGSSFIVELPLLAKA